MIASFLALYAVTWVFGITSMGLGLALGAQVSAVNLGWPKLVTVAGFERGTGVLINITPPELAASELRRVEPVGRAS